VATTQAIRQRKNSPPPAGPAPEAPKKGPANGAETGAAEPIEIPAAEDDFWLFLSGFDTDHWQYLIAYLWRCFPITDRSTGGKPTSVCKYTRPFDLDAIMHEYGSGTYRIDLCRIAATGNKQTRIRQHYFTIMNLTFPPKVPLGDWVNSPENSMWKWAEAPLKASQQAADAAPATATPTDPNQLFNTVLHGMQVLRGDQADNSTLAAQVLQMVQSSQAQMAELTDPTKQLTTLRELLNLITPPKGDSSETKLIVDLLREDLKETRAELSRIRESQAGRKSVLEEIKEAMPMVVEFANMLGFKRAAAAGGGAASEWAGVVSAAVDKIGDHVPMIVDAIKSRNAAAPQPNIWPTLPNRQASGQTAAPAPAQETAPAQEAANMTDDQKKEQRVKALLQRYGQLIQLIAPIMVDHFRSHYSGYDFRNWFLDRHGLLNWTGLKDEGGAELLTEIAQAHPMLKTALAPPERLLAFLAEFFTERGQEPPEAVIPDEQEEEPTPDAA
jgi:hypothetical protein